ncbi:DedA family protein [Mycetocola spongiae]|uniref:DedA family protein n=1 Tax=Mycetocola spongiae TaxID=2859226 RepID=UPI001CF1B1E8|nr:DedA family protein [Mycetocola spongiae]UCR89096.1 DedA family protein [Mycetocola spongiae]
MHTGLIPWLDSTHILESAGPFAVLVVCAIVFAETGLLVGFMLPGDTLLVITGLMSNPESNPSGLGMPIWAVCLLIGVAAFIGGEVGYLIGHRLGPKVFERKESGLFSVENVKRTNKFFEKWGPFAIVIARFVPVVRTFAPVAAGVAHMNYRRYSLYNFIGAMIWGAGLTYFGYLIGYIPPVANFVSSYIDIILLCAVAISVGPAAVHYFLAMRKTKKLNAAAAEARAEAALTPAEAEEAASAVLSGTEAAPVAEPEADINIDFGAESTRRRDPDAPRD